MCQLCLWQLSTSSCLPNNKWTTQVSPSTLWMYLNVMGWELTLQQSVPLHVRQCECTALQRMVTMLCLGYIHFINSVKIEQILLAFARDIFLIPRKYQALLQAMVVSKGSSQVLLRCIILRNKGKKSLTYFPTYYRQKIKDIFLPS